MDQALDPKSMPRPTWSTTAAAVAVAAVVAAAVIVLLFARPGSPPSPSPNPDARWQPPPLAEFRDAKETSLEDGTRLIAQREAKFTVDGARQITLRRGAVYLIVAKSDEPFVVENQRRGGPSPRERGSQFRQARKRRRRSPRAGSLCRATRAKWRCFPASRARCDRERRRPRSPAPRLSHLVSWAREALAMEQPLVKAQEKQDGLVALDPWGQEAHLTLREYNVDVHIEDGIARTTIDQTFFNHYPWNTGGHVLLSPSPDASVSRLAMYVGEDLNEGGMVERSYGQTVYNDIRYQWREPGPAGDDGGQCLQDADLPPGGTAGKADLYQLHTGAEGAVRNAAVLVPDGPYQQRRETAVDTRAGQGRGPTPTRPSRARTTSTSPPAATTSC